MPPDLTDIWTFVQRDPDLREQFASMRKVGSTWCIGSDPWFDCHLCRVMFDACEYDYCPVCDVWERFYADRKARELAAVAFLWYVPKGRLH